MNLIDFEILRRGGPMVWVLIALAVVGMLIAIERFIFLRRNHVRPKAFIDGIRNILEKRRIVEALTVCEETPGPVASVVKTALLHADDDRERMRLNVQEAAIIELPALERRIQSLAVIAQAAPLAGILGAVLGMMATFRQFEQDYMAPTALADGMWQALLAAAGGLLVAIPAHLAHHYLTGQVRAIVHEVEWAANEIMRFLLSEYRDSPDGGNMDERGQGVDQGGEPRS